MYVLQVDDLKEKLAAQEVELKQKNEDADALIQRVGVEQEKVYMYVLSTDCPMAVICFCMYVCCVLLLYIRRSVRRKR